MSGDVVGQAFAWIESVAVAADGGLSWAEDGKPSDDLYVGTASVLLGCTEALSAGACGAVTRVAAGARDRLLHIASNGAEIEDGLFEGWPGVAVALRAWADVTGDEAAGKAAATVTAAVAERMRRRDDDPARCTDVISGDAGVLLALVDDCADPAVAEAAVKLADGLAGLALERPDGLHWQMMMTPEYEHLLPGFSHGTAGVAYALARVGETLGRTDLIDVAVRAADGLLALGHQPGGGWAVPLLIPPKPDRPTVNFGWCHGPTGTLRLFALLDTLVPDPRWGRGIEACLQGLRDSRIPERLYPGYWDNVARCCGTAGVGQVLLNRHHATGDPSLLAWSQRLADDVIARRLTTPAGVTWSNVEHTATPPDLPPEPGFMQGSAGVAGWLARLDTPGSGPVLPWL
ncbi:lanthionine synthetase LanC family protein [Paractinoplanes durhamensis]|uniref:lanthionine synthetase LanC family protein n=1 Tax=Paractinoplanes durhamensis TaxID=113563 RepID=UPI00194043E9|nr:lanthionine synthetase LanC family protein [Actinoplanes durhamensis]